MPITDADYWISRALERPGGRGDGGFWLACQLRDNRISGRPAEAAMRDYARRCPPKDHPYTEREAVRTWKNVQTTTPREPSGYDDEEDYDPPPLQGREKRLNNLYEQIADDADFEKATKRFERLRPRFRQWRRNYDQWLEGSDEWVYRPYCPGYKKRVHRCRACDDRSGSDGGGSDED